MSTHGQIELSQPPSDVISSIKYSPSDPNHLLVASWDRSVCLYDTHAETGGKLIKKIQHRAPVLDVCFGSSDDEAFSCGLDWDVRRIDLQTGEQTVLSSHKAGARNVVYSREHNLLISGSWDSTLHIHPLSAQTPKFSTVPLPDKCFSLSVSPTKLVVAMANRAVNIYDLKGLQMLVDSSPADSPHILEVQPWQTRESSMKYMTRAVACMPNDAGYASSSIEGRVAVEWFDPSEESQSRKYAFKCHRNAVEGVDWVYPVNALAYHPIHGTFASGGGDGVVALWDGVAKRRIRQYQRFKSSVASLAFSCDGKYLATAISPGFETGGEGGVLGEGSVNIYIRELAENEAVAKPKK